jgi:uncharacterized protein (DUF433 family)
MRCGVCSYAACSMVIGMIHRKVTTLKYKLVSSDPAIMMGKPVIAGTRITVESILDRFAAGETIDQMLAAHPRLTKEAIFAAFFVKNLRLKLPH